MIDSRDSYSEPLKLGKHLPINLDDAYKRKNSDFHTSPESFAHAVRVLMLGYALVSAADGERPWCSLGAALKRISTVENLSRISAKSGHVCHHKIVEAEMNVRCEWARIAQAETILRLSDVIEIVGQRFAIWPISAELKGVGGKGSFNRNKLTSFNPYSQENWRGNNREYSSSSWQVPNKGGVVEYFLY